MIKTLKGFTILHDSEIKKCYKEHCYWAVWKILFDFTINCLNSVSNIILIVNI